MSNAVAILAVETVIMPIIEYASARIAPSASPLSGDHHAEFSPGNHTCADADCDLPPLATSAQTAADRFRDAARRQEERGQHYHLWILEDRKIEMQSDLREKNRTSSAVTPFEGSCTL